MKEENQYLKLIKGFLKWTAFSLILGIAVGIVVGYFNIILSKANDYRKEHEYLVYFLPIAGVLISYMYVHCERNAFSGENLLKSEVVNAAKDIPFYMSFVVFLGSLATTLFGGSAGKEGSAVALGGTFADFLARKLHLSREEQKILVIISVGSAFGVIYNVPFAGAILGMELILKGKFHYEALIPAFLTSVISNETALKIGNKVIKYPKLNLGNLNFILIMKLILLGILIGVIGIIFNYVLDNSSKVYSFFIKSPLIKGFVGGVITIILVLMLGENYNGLGTSYIKESFTTSVSFFDFIFKILFTAVALGSVFQGGRGNPTFFVVQQPFQLHQLQWL